MVEMSFFEMQVQKLNFNNSIFQFKHYVLSVMHYDFI